MFLKMDNACRMAPNCYQPKTKAFLLLKPLLLIRKSPKDKYFYLTLNLTSPGGIDITNKSQCWLGTQKYHQMQIGSMALP